MMTSDGVADPAARLREIEGDLSYLRGVLGDRSSDPQDFGDAGLDLEEREQQAAMIEDLEAERDRLRKQLGLG